MRAFPEGRQKATVDFAVEKVTDPGGSSRCTQFRTGFFTVAKIESAPFSRTILENAQYLENPCTQPCACGAAEKDCPRPACSDRIRNMRKPSLWCSSFRCFFSRLTRPSGQPPKGRRALRAGQAYTEYLLILLFGVFLGLGIAVVDGYLPQELRIVSRLYGYFFDYYAGLANYLNLPLF